ncbi:SRPBCC family protein [Parashewanella curva]|uniref:SRPBCC family protein n=1 Tax=Parashewanella curva TaxID=2338552 RepID=A0A3L8PTV4_9GAMM|nr:SRPBCC family protein [Parashewanella curva]RLV57838.1 SRPBCC family protein [Parashewanella curva]
MRILFISLGIILLSILIIWLWGSTLSSTHKVEVQQTIRAPINRVWEVMTDWQNQPIWRKELKSVEVISPSEFIESAKHGSKIKFTVVKSVSPQNFELEMSGFVQGEYIATLSDIDGITKVSATEIVTQTSSFKRVLSYMFFDLNAFANEYLLQLKKYVEQ